MVALRAPGVKEQGQHEYGGKPGGKAVQHLLQAGEVARQAERPGSAIGANGM